MRYSLKDRLQILVKRWQDFREDYKEVNKVPTNIDFNRLLESLELIVKEANEGKK